MFNILTLKNNSPEYLVFSKLTLSDFPEIKIHNFDFIVLENPNFLLKKILYNNINGITGIFIREFFEEVINDKVRPKFEKFYENNL